MPELPQSRPFRASLFAGAFGGLVTGAFAPMVYNPLLPPG